RAPSDLACRRYRNAFSSGPVSRWPNHCKVPNVSASCASTLRDSLELVRRRGELARPAAVAPRLLAQRGLRGLVGVRPPPPIAPPFPLLNAISTGHGKCNPMGLLLPVGSRSTASAPR